jgi:uncharacterized protein
MQYRQFPKINVKVSALGAGAMRLPTIPGSDEIDEKHTAEMLYTAIDNGVNYVDTAYPYHKKMSETIVGKILAREGYRDKVHLATKLPPWELNTKEDLDRIFEEQCTKLQTDRIDFYLIHCLNKSNWKKVQELDIFDWLEKKVARGRITYPGFSFHDKYPMFETIIDAYDWAFCQIQYNYMDIENQAGTKGLQYAASKNVGVIAMEPLLGGKLVYAPPAVEEIWNSAPVKRTPVEWALDWLWNQPEVTVVLSGMSSTGQVKENLLYADKAHASMLTTDELLLFDKTREAYSRLSPIPCTKCDYCMPCPQDINIPWNFGLYNEGVMYDCLEKVRGEFNFIPEKSRAENCISCGVCEDKCPQQIPISEWMEKVDNVLSKGAPYPE